MLEYIDYWNSPMRFIFCRENRCIKYYYGLKIILKTANLKGVEPMYIIFDVKPFPVAKSEMHSIP